MPEKTVLRAVIDGAGLSRRKAFDVIRAGRVAIDGAAVLDPSRPFAGGSLSLDGEALGRGVPGRVYLLMHKPPGVITANFDPEGRPIVLDLVPPRLRASGLHPVGRLDRDTTGLLILTNDGDFTFRLTHPKHEVEKEYWLSASPRITDQAIQIMRGGAEIDGRIRTPVAVDRLRGQAPFEASITIREGRRRHVRRLVLATGAKVTRLRRVREGTLALGGLAEGAVRELTKAEVAALGG